MEVVMGAELEPTIRKFIAENLMYRNDLSISDEESLLDNGVIDSTSVLELILFVEQNFGIEVRDEEVVPDNFDSVKRIGDYVRSKL